MADGQSKVQAISNIRAKFYKGKAEVQFVGWCPLSLRFRQFTAHGCDMAAADARGGHADMLEALWPQRVHRVHERLQLMAARLWPPQGHHHAW